jgi:tetratricopeptide (TPR) repeat protein
MKWLILSILSIIFLYTPFKRGLFFSPDIYITTIILTVLFFIWLAVISFRKNESFPMIYLGLFILPFIYYLTLTVAETPSGNFDNLFGWLAYICFFILVLWVRGTEKAGDVLPYIFHIAGVSMAFFALFGIWEWVDYQDVVLGDRTTGPFQYANAFAAVIGAFWIYALMYLTRQRISWYALLIFSFPLVAYGVGFFHSYSRGALLVFPIVWLIGLFCLRAREQVLYVLYSTVSVIGSFIVFRIMVEEEQMAEISNPGLWVFVISTIVVIGCCLSLNYVNQSRYVEKVRHLYLEKTYLRFILPVLVIVLGILLWIDLQNEGAVYSQLPSTLQERLSSINFETGSATARTNMFADAWTMSKDAPILGYGGEGWRNLYASYQTLPYLSNEIHNGYLEILLNTGWLGLLLFMASFLFLFGQIIYRAWKEKSSEDQPWILAVIPALLMIFIHAAIDFDFSFGTVWFIIFWLFAMGVPYQPVLPSLGKFNNLISYKKLTVFKRTLIVGLALGVFIGGLYSYRFYLAKTEVAKAGNSMTIDEGLLIFGNASSKNPYNVDYWINLAHVYSAGFKQNSQEAYKDNMIEALDNAERLEPRNPNVLYKIANAYRDINESARAIEYYVKALDYDRFNVVFYDTILNYKFQLVEQRLKNGEEEAAFELAGSLVKDYEKYLKWHTEWKDVQVPDRRPLNVDKQSHLLAADSYRMLSQFAKALEVFKSQGVVIDSVLHDEENSNFANKPFQILSLNQVISNHLDKIIILSARDEASANLSAESKLFLGNLGSNIADLAYRGSFISVIAGGQVIFDKFSNDASIEINQDTAQGLISIFANKPFTIQSAGMNAGNRSSIVIDGVEYSEKGRGINIAVFDEEMNPVDTYHFDTHLSDMKAIPLD